MTISEKVEKQYDEIEKLKSDMLSISSDITVIVTEQRYITETLKEIKSKVCHIEDGLTQAKIKIDDMEKYDKFKQEFLERTLSYIKVLAVAAPIIIGAISYAAYDWGLYKPTPVASAPSTAS